MANQEICREASVEMMDRIQALIQLRENNPKTVFRGDRFGRNILDLFDRVDVKSNLEFELITTGNQERA